MASADDPHRRLAARIRGSVVTPGDPAYDHARRGWNARFDRRPAAIVMVGDADDVAAALDHAAALDLPVVVRGGGHSPAGWSSCEGGIVIDLRRLGRIDIASDGTVVVGGGVVAGDLINALDERDLALPVGTCAAVGIGGLALGGGLGHLNGRHGLTSDRLRFADLVLADGRCLTVSADREPDLFWAIRGAGANFGVATRLGFQACDAAAGFGGTLVFRGRPPPDVVDAFGALCADAAGHLGAELRLFDDGATVSVFLPGAAEAGGELVRALHRLGSPAAGRLGPLRYAALAGVDDGGPRGQAYYQRSANLPRLDAAAAAAIADNHRGPGGPGFMTLIHRRHGAAARLADGAYPHRSAAFETTFVAAWDPALDAAALRRRVDRAWHSVGGGRLPVYVNMLDDEEPSRIDAAYGASRPRLERLKARYDPLNRFRGNANIRPAV